MSRPKQDEMTFVDTESEGVKHRDIPANELDATLAEIRAAGGHWLAVDVTSPGTYRVHYREARLTEASLW